MTMNGQQTSDDNQPFLGLQRVYVKDMSFEAPGVPAVFKEEWKPDVQLDLQTDSRQLEPHVYEVVLSLTVTAKSGEQTTFLLEVKQAGIFTVKNFPEAQIQAILNAYCPGTLYPYAREAVTDLVNRGSFPQLLLAPINFDALYAQKQEEMKSTTTGASA